MNDLPADFAQREFWTDYLLITDDQGRKYPELEGYQIEFRVSDRYALVLALFSDLWYVTLSLLPESPAEPIELGSDNGARFFPFVLRWCELEAICWCVGQRTGTSDPGIALLLLHRFVLIDPVDGDDPFAQLIQAWHATSLFTDEEVRQLVARWRLGHSTNADRWWEWHEAQGWVVSGDTAYSARRSTIATFPFSMLNDLVKQAERHDARSRTE